ncbi:MAG: hypothetical protein COV60_02510 [Candidatus Magasanikbacteria bacterium CG11_big_fil_rev_8_21_14_0_20_43_7]|uniref:PAS domain-containing protein n=1 Tax=Candidatus Magasanikbacteria bacterium CG11_big_fil_rev_8_21_14_0_20_43_7 TaxID=1974654 RepID=A0A2H0N2C7_9BACT|nr:MAG: hypothetical protein COV60_02510 [Candidatus Magasanikbacteria bacterium CG11_big_fil_rev_8_21_14_0_20_43_7]
MAETHLEDRHIRTRLKIIHWVGIGIFIAFFVVLFVLQSFLDIETSIAQYTILVMAGILSLSYLSLLHHPSGVPVAPLISFYLLGAVTTVLVWSTGLFQSPFIIVYVIMIIITSQLYHYVHGLAMTLLSVLGLVFMYGMSVGGGGLSSYSLMYYTDADLLYQPPLVIMMNATLYTLLFLYTVFSTSTARVMLFRPTKSIIDSTIDEQIIRDAPMGILAVDDSGIILSSNPYATKEFGLSASTGLLAKFLGISAERLTKDLHTLARFGKEKSYPVEDISVVLSARGVGQGGSEMKVVFVREE